MLGLGVEAKSLTLAFRFEVLAWPEKKKKMKKFYFAEQIKITKQWTIKQ